MLIELTGVDATVEDIGNKMQPILQELFRTVRYRAATVLRPQVKPLPGAIRLVKHLHAHGIPIAVRRGLGRRCGSDFLSCLTDATDRDRIAARQPRDQELRPARAVRLLLARSHRHCGHARRARTARQARGGHLRARGAAARTDDGRGALEDARFRGRRARCRSCASGARTASRSS